MNNDNLTPGRWKTAMRLGAALLTIGLMCGAYLYTNPQTSNSAIDERANEINPGSSRDLLAPTSQEPNTVEPPDEVPAPKPPDTSATALRLATLEQELLIATDLETGSKEFSGITVNEDLDRVLIVDDEDLLFEFDLDATGALLTPPRRTIRISAGAGDIEGIAWMTGTTYVLAHEIDGRLTVVTINEEATEIASANVLRTIDTGVDGEDGKGIEGVAYLNQAARGSSSIEFIVVQERPATLLLIDRLGKIVTAQALELPDASGVWAASPEQIIVVSDEGRTLVELQIASRGAVTVLGRLSLQLPDGHFEQPEGIAWNQKSDRLYVVGEDPGPGRYSIGWWQTSP